jgi:P-type conjugative transfer ATPase TrbB
LDNTSFSSAKTADPTVSQLHLVQLKAQERLEKMLKTALGEVEKYMHDKSVIEIMLNPDHHLWIDKLGEGRIDTGIIINPGNAERFIGYVSSATESVCNYENPILSTELPGYGSRFEALISPVVVSPTFTIRQKAVMVFTLEDYVTQGILTVKQREKMIHAVHSKKNILIIGGTGSGKTTLANAILDEIAKTKDRIIIIEDTQELQCTAPDTVFLRTRDHVSANRLLKSTMRLRPDRIVLGEVRDKTALDLLKAWNTGHPGGLSTIHANSAIDGLLRLDQLIQEAGVAPMPKFIGQAVDFVIFIEKVGHHRKVQEIAEVKGFDIKKDEYIFELLE